jgi:hypothetical protein
MAWVWQQPLAQLEFGADMDYAASAPMLGVEYLWAKPINTSLMPIFRSRSGIKRFQRFHCPPIGLAPAVDQVWKDIILKYVPENRVQFLPIRLIARGEVCDDYMWIVPFDQVRCIDPVKSGVRSKIERPDITLIFGLNKCIHHPNCLGDLHMARDEQMSSHLVISEELKNALAVTGEDSMFYQPEDVWSLNNLADKLKDVL